jgi:hypothetical protein
VVTMRDKKLIRQKFQDFKFAERLAQKSQLTKKDVNELSMKVKQDMEKHVKQLLKQL